jgi:hypothetical protein
MKKEEQPMSDFRREDPPRELTILRKHQESNTMLAIVMAGIAALFLVAIVSAYNYASSTSTALHPNPPASASAPATRMAPETSGSGPSATPQRAVPDQSQKQQ